LSSAFWRLRRLGAVNWSIAGSFDVTRGGKTAFLWNSLI
jgi:hypothetical protein